MSESRIKIYEFNHMPNEQDYNSKYNNKNFSPKLKTVIISQKFSDKI